MKRKGVGTSKPGLEGVGCGKHAALRTACGVAGSMSVPVCIRDGWQGHGHDICRRCTTCARVGLLW